MIVVLLPGMPNCEIIHSPNNYAKLSGFVTQSKQIVKTFP
jgi:hypothetical protein